MTSQITEIDDQSTVNNISEASADSNEIDEINNDETTANKPVDNNTTTVSAIINKPIRDKNIKEFMNLLSMEFATRLEEATYSYINEYCNINYTPVHLQIPSYTMKCRDIYVNLDSTNEDINNNYLLNAIKECVFPVEIVPLLTPEELHPENWKKIVEKNKLTESYKAAITTDMYVCSKCKNRKFIIYQLQTRGADEPMTTFNTCTVCYNTFRK